jgi:hypothetical protein
MLCPFLFHFLFQSQRVKPSLRLCHLSPFPKPKGERTVLLWIASRRSDMMLTSGPRSRPSCSRTCRQFKMPLDGSVMREQWDGHEGLGHPCLTCVESTTRPRSSRSLLLVHLLPSPGELSLLHTGAWRVRDANGKKTLSRLSQDVPDDLLMFNTC